MAATNFGSCNSKLNWLNSNRFRVRLKAFLLLYGAVILFCFFVFRNYFGIQTIYNEWNANRSRFVRDYVHPEKLTTLSFVQSPCTQDQQPLTLIVVCSSVENYSLRRAVRETWASQTKEHNIHVLFLIGQSKDDLINNRMFEESLQHKDLIVENFIDSYYNLTIKSILLLKWVKNNCQSTRFVMKIDDDVYFNVGNFVKLTKSEKVLGEKYLIGKLYTKEKPYRTPDSKWYVPQSAYPSDAYPHFLCGVGYLMSTDVALQLYEESFKHQLIFIEDVFLTGIVAEEIDVKRRDHLGFHFFEHSVEVECNSIHAHMILLSHHVSPKEMRKIHTQIAECDV